MPPVGIRRLHQKAVLWAFSDYDDYSNVRVSSPVEIDVRWEQQTTEQISDDASPIAINGTIFVDRDIERGSILWLGKLADLPSPVTSGLVEAVSMNKIPDIKGRKYTRVLTIKKYRDSLPTVV